MSTEPRQDEEPAPVAIGGFWNNVVLLVGSVGLVLVVVWGVPYTVKELQEEGAFRPEIILPVILIIGLIVLVGALAALAATFSRLGIASRTAPLGMPEGSVQAVIALGLIIIFAIVGVYLIGAEDPTRVLPGLSRAELEVLPPNSIVHFQEMDDGQYDVTVTATDSNQHELALQLLTTVSTLVVAVAAFYFGQKSIGEASKAIAVAAPAVVEETTITKVTEKEAAQGRSTPDPKQPSPGNQPGQSRKGLRRPGRKGRK